jgi:hypothetical protein
MNTTIETPHADVEAGSMESDHAALRLWLRRNPVYDHPSSSAGKHGT